MPQTLRGQEALDLIIDCENQVRARPGGVTAVNGQFLTLPSRVDGLDFTAILAFARAQGVDLRFLSDVLPEVEPLIIYHHNKDDTPDDYEEGGGEAID